MLTVDDLKTALPSHLRSAATQELADKVNQAATDPEAAAAIRESFISYSSVLQDGRFKIEDYLNACSYVSYKLMGNSNQDAYAKAFPQRYQGLLKQGKTSKEISAYVAHYNGGKLVNLILEQSIIPSWVLYQDVYAEAIKTQFELMQTANSEKVRTEAANSILTHLKRPETRKIELDVSPAAADGLSDLRKMMTQLAQTQIDLIEGGVSTRDVAKQKLVQREIIDITPQEEGDDEE